MSRLPSLSLSQSPLILFKTGFRAFSRWTSRLTMGTSNSLSPRAFSILIPLVATYQVFGALVPDHWLNVTEFLNGPAELFVFRIARLQVLAGVVWRRFDLYGFCGFPELSPHLFPKCYVFKKKRPLRILINSFSVFSLVYASTLPQLL